MLTVCVSVLTVLLLFCFTVLTLSTVKAVLFIYVLTVLQCYCVSVTMLIDFAVLLCYCVYCVVCSLCQI